MYAPRSEILYLGRFGPHTGIMENPLVVGRVQIKVIWVTEEKKII